MKQRSKHLEGLGKNIRALRKKAGHSQDSLAYELELGRSYYGSLERGEINASFLTLMKITQALNVELKDVIPNTLKK